MTSHFTTLLVGHLGLLDYLVVECLYFSKAAGFSYAGPLLARLIPRCTDPVIRIRQLAIEAVQTLLRISACFEGGAQNPYRVT